jgi:hypothetical protein
MARKPAMVAAVLAMAMLLAVVPASAQEEVVQSPPPPPEVVVDSFPPPPEQIVESPPPPPEVVESPPPPPPPAVAPGDACDSCTAPTTVSECMEFLPGNCVRDDALACVPKITPKPTTATCGPPPAGFCDAQDTCNGAGECVAKNNCGTPGCTAPAPGQGCDWAGFGSGKNAKNAKNAKIKMCCKSSCQAPEGKCKP